MILIMKLKRNNVLNIAWNDTISQVYQDFEIRKYFSHGTAQVEPESVYFVDVIESEDSCGKTKKLQLRRQLVPLETIFW